MLRIELGENLFYLVTSALNLERLLLQVGQLTEFGEQALQCHVELLLDFFELVCLFTHVVLVVTWVDYLQHVTSIGGHLCRESITLSLNKLILTIDGVVLCLEQVSIHGEEVCKRLSKL